MGLYFLKSLKFKVMSGKLIRLTAVDTSAAGRIYARDIVGNTYFPQNKDMELKVGMYAYAVVTVQNKTRDDAGELVDLAIPVNINQITAAFVTKAEAVEAAAEAATLTMEVGAAVALQAKELKLDDAAVARLANAW